MRKVDLEKVEWYEKDICSSYVCVHSSTENLSSTNRNIRQAFAVSLKKCVQNKFQIVCKNTNIIFSNKTLL